MHMKGGLRDLRAPTTGPERGEALKRVIRSCGVTLPEFAKQAGCGLQTIQMLINGGRTKLGRDLATRTTDDVARRISAAIFELEPWYTNSHLWHVLGIPEERRDVWRRPDSKPAEPQTVEASSTWGVIAVDHPVSVSVGEGPHGLQVWRTGSSLAILPEGETPTGAAHLGALVGLSSSK